MVLIMSASLLRKGSFLAYLSVLALGMFSILAYQPAYAHALLFILSSRTFQLRVIPEF